MRPSRAWELLWIRADWAVVSLLAYCALIDRHLSALVAIWAWPTIRDTSSEKVVIVSALWAKGDWLSTLAVCTSWAGVFGVVSRAFWTVVARWTVCASVELRSGSLSNASFTSGALCLDSSCAI